MENQALRDLKVQSGPCIYKLADQPPRPKAKRDNKSRRRPSSDSSSEKKPPKQKLKFDEFDLAVDVKRQVADIDARTNNTAMSGANNDPKGPPASYAAVAAGKQGEIFCKDFLKMDQVKKGLRDEKAEKKHRKKTPCHYEALAEHKFVGDTYTVNELQPKLEPIQVVGIIMAHSSYKGKYIEAITSLSVSIKLAFWALITHVWVSSRWRNPFLRS